jgi:hypothetical protein
VDDGQRLPDVEFLSFSLINARSLNNKLSELQYILRHDKLDVLCITETWLNPVTVDALITDGCHYSVLRTDRVSPHNGGGVCIITNNDTTKTVPISIPSKY